MRQQVRIAATTFALLALTVPARADWPPSHWGMTAAEVVAAVPDAIEVRRKPGGGQDVWDHHRLAVAPMVLEGEAGQAEYYFHPDDKKLGLVRMEPDDISRCPALRDALVARYGDGTPMEERFGLSGMRWTDADNGDRMLFAMVSHSDGTTIHCHFIVQEPE
ncbi:MAG: hypothetical protein CMN73_15605 [Sphingomonas sp.]|nr:hypothetical protein [Sphingomonas sp.]